MAIRGGAQIARSLAQVPAAWVMAARQRPVSADARTVGSVVASGARQPAQVLGKAHGAPALKLKQSAHAVGPAVAALASQRALTMCGGIFGIGAGGSRASAAAAAAAAAAFASGVRSVGTVHRGKIMGNVVEAWEKRTVEKIVETRDPAHFDDFRVSNSIKRSCVFFSAASTTPNPTLHSCYRRC